MAIPQYLGAFLPAWGHHVASRTISWHVALVGIICFPMVSFIILDEPDQLHLRYPPRSIDRRPGGSRPPSTMRPPAPPATIGRGPPGPPPATMRPLGPPGPPQTVPPRTRHDGGWQGCEGLSIQHIRYCQFPRFKVKNAGEGVLRLRWGIHDSVRIW